MIAAILIAAVNSISFILIAPYAPSATAGVALLLPVFIFSDISRLSPILYGYLTGPAWKVFLISGMWGLGTVVGSLVSSLTSRSFRIRKPRRIDVARSFFGGLLMGVGVSLAHGCNLLHSLGGTPLLVPASILVTISILIGAYVCLKLILKFGV
jgi:hypothetical protein